MSKLVLGVVAGTSAVGRVALGGIIGTIVCRHVVVGIAARGLAVDAGA